MDALRFSYASSLLFFLEFKAETGYNLDVRSLPSRENCRCSADERQLAAIISGHSTPKESIL